MLPIRQTLNALPGLNRTAKAVLIEVCELAEHGTHGCCTAKNEYLVERLGGTERTISRALATLEQLGLLRSQGMGKARRLAATPALRACYAAPDEAQRRAAAVALNLDKTAANLDNLNPANLDKNDAQPRQNDQVGGVEEATNLDKSGSQPRQNGYANLDKSGHQPRQNWSRVLGDDQYDQNDQEALSGDERASLEKKIAELEAENVRLRSQLAQAVAPPVAAPPPGGGYRNFSGEWPEQLHPPFATPAFREAWGRFAAYLAELGKPFRGHQHEEAALRKLRSLASTDHALALKALDDTMANGWLNLNLDYSKPRPAEESPPKSKPGQVAARRDVIEETLLKRRERREASQPATPA